MRSLLHLIHQRVFISILIFVGSLPLYGQVWTPSIIDPTINFSGAFFLDANMGYAVGGSGTGAIRKTVDGGQTWTSQVSGTSSWLQDIYFLTSNIGYAVGENGVIRKTINGGANWTAQTATGTSSIRFFEVAFPDVSTPNTGFIVGTDGVILKTTDGGSNWVAKTSGVTDWIMGLYFTSLTTGYACTNMGKVLKTTNTGESWTVIPSGTGQTLYDIYFTDASTGYIAGHNGTILKSIDAGLTWNPQTSGGTINLKRVHFVNSTTGYIVGENGVALRTINGGTNWVAQTTGTTTSLEGLHFSAASGATGYAVGNSGGLVKYQAVTEPSAQPSALTFSDVFGSSMMISFTDAIGSPTGYFVVRKSGATAPSTDPLDAVTYNPGDVLGDGIVAYAGPSNVFVLEGLTANTQYNFKVYAYNGTGDEINYRLTLPLTGNQTTYSSGQPWTQKSNPNYTARDVHFGDALTGAAVGGYTLQTTNDGGETWTERFMGNGEGYGGVYFTSSTTGYVAGYYGPNPVIRKTTDGGVNWNALTVPGTAPMNDVWFTSATIGYAVGGSGAILKTTNAGVDWTPLTSGTTEYLSSITFASNGTTGYVVGSSGKILKTTNSGASWSTQTSGTTHDLYSVSFNSASNGLAVGSSGTILKTTNGGTTWTPQSSSASDVLGGVHSLNTNIACIVGNFGVILKTTNGGEDWIEQPTGTSSDNNLYGVYFLNQHNGFAVGDRIFKYQSVPEPASQPTNLVFSAIASSTATVTFTASVDNPAGYVVVRKAGSTPAAQPVDGTAYTAGATLGDATIAYSGSAVTFNETSLSGGTRYYYKVYAYHSAGATSSNNYSTTSPLTNNFTTIATEPGAQPTALVFSGVQSASLTVSYSAATGSPAGYVVVRRLGSAPTSDPADGTTYSVNGTIGNGTVVYVGSNLTFNQSGLVESTQYFYKVYAYNGSGSTINYRQASPLSGSVFTLDTEPSSQPAILQFDNVDTGSLQINFTEGSSSGTIIIRRAGSSPTTAPLDGTAYSAGQSLGNGVVAYIGSSNSFNDSGLSPETQYYYSLYAFNGSGVNTNFLTTEPLVGNVFTLSPEPANQPNNAVMSLVTPTSFSVSFTPAQDTPDGYIVMRGDGTVPQTAPEDGVEYSDGEVFPNALVTHVGSQVSFEEIDLEPGTLYYYRIYAFNGSGQTINYRLSDPLVAHFYSLPSAPEVQPATVVTQNSFTANWTNVSGVDGYRLDVSNDMFQTIMDQFDNLEVNGNSYIVAGLAAGITYSYRMRAMNSSGSSSNSTTRTQITVPPIALASTASAVGQTGFIANWNNVTGATEYLLDVSANNFDSFATGYSSKSVMGTSEMVSGLSPGVEYAYRVKAKNAGGVSAVSNTIIQLLIPATPIALDAVNVRANDFVAKWQDVEGESNFVIDVSADNFLTFTNGFQAAAIDANATQVSVTGLQPNKSYKYRVRAINTTGPSTDSNVITVSTQATGGATPLVMGEPVFTSTTTSGAVVSVSVTGGSGSINVTLQHKGIMDGVFSETVAAVKTSNIYEATIDASVADELGIEFYFEASDGSSEVTQPVHRFIYKAVDASTSQPIPFAEGFNGSPSSYQMFSVPYVLNEKEIRNVFDEWGSYDKTQWKLYHYQGGKNVEFENGLNNIEIGRGYWFNAKEKRSVLPGTGVVTQVTSSQPFTLVFEKGWNQIGNPYPFGLDWQVIRDANTTTGLNSLWFYENGSYVKKDVLLPWKGAFIYSDQGGSVTFPFSAKSSNAGRTSNGAARIDEDHWNLPLTLELGQLTAEGGIGMHPEASLSKDRFDEILAPRFMDYLELSTWHDEFDAHEFSTDVVATTNVHSWKFIASSNINGNGRIKWDSRILDVEGASVILVDLEDQTWVDMKTTNNYEFTIKNSRSLMIQFSREGELNTGFNLLGQAFPNPFTDAVTIPVLIGDNRSVHLQVYDLLGREVRSIQTTFNRPGVHSFLWDGKNNEGVPVPNGILLYRLSGSQAKRLIKR